MKSLRKLFAVTVVIALVLGTMAVGGSAAGLTDVAGAKFADAANRLAAFGVLTGYPDGTFKGSNNITRAEFAAVAVRALGLKGAAEAAAGATKFSDVAASHWASGYVNVASDQGIIKGYPDGTFKPDANVSYAEALTMLIRALGYEPLIRGTWPTGYLAKAQELGLTTGVSFLANNAATRGDVAIFTDKTLDEKPMVETGWDSTGKVTYGKATKPLVEEKLGYTSAEGRLTDLGTLFSSSLKTSQVKIGGTDYDLAEGVDLSGLLGEKVKFWKNSDDEVFYAQSKTNASDIKTDTVKTNATGSVTLKDLDKTYNLAASVTLVKDKSASTVASLTADDIKDYKGKFVLNSDGNIDFIIVTKYISKAVKSVSADNNGITLVGGAFLDVKDAKILDISGAATAVSGIQKDDVLDYINSGSGKDSKWNIIVTRKSASGDLTKISATGSSLSSYTVTVGGTDYKGSSTLVDKDGNSTTYESYINKNVTVLLNKDNKVVLIKSAAAADKTYAAMRADVRVTSEATPQHVIDVLKADGTKVSLVLAKPTIKNGATEKTYDSTKTTPDTDNLNGLSGPKAPSTRGDIISYTLNSEGKVNKIVIEVDDPSGSALTVDKDNDLIGGKVMTSKTAFFNLITYDDPKVTSQSAVEGQTPVTAVVVEDSDFLSKAAIVVVTGGTLTSESKRAAVISRYRVGDDWYLSLNSKGTVTDYKVSGSTVANAVYYSSTTDIAGFSNNFSDINGKDVIKFQLDGAGKVDLSTVNEQAAVGVSSGSKDRVVRISAIDSDQKLVKIDIYAAGSSQVESSEYYVVNDKTHLYNITGDSPTAISFSDLHVGDKVKVISEDRVVGTGGIANVITVK